ncbi:MAG: adenylyltransferase/cytidyltransferase family protein [Actinomycetota bacterium]|nr:adenylyltransferase/cytidyltransferase family protein [Actinomycetota bacterium]
MRLARTGVPRREQSAAPTLVGYTAGVFDMLHIGHLNLFRAASQRCGLLIAGVTTDELALEQRGERPVIPLLERMALVQHVRYVDHVVPQSSVDKVEAWEVLRFDVLFAGDNLRGTPRWLAVEQDMAEVGVRVVYLPATHVRSGGLLSRGLSDLVAY